jgi:hypothetical protein
LPLGWLRSTLAHRTHRNPKHNRKQNLFHQYGSLDLLGNSSTGKRVSETSSNCIPAGPLCIRILLWNARLSFWQGTGKRMFLLERIASDPFFRMAGL